MRFTCPRCGKKYASADEPAPGRVYSLTCRCGTKITVKGPEPSSGAPATAQVAGHGGDAFPAERRRVQGGAPVSSVDAGSLPGKGGPGGWTSRTQTTQIPLKEATPTPPSLAPRAPLPAPAPPQAAPLDPFADMPDLQAAARGEARPLTSIPEIRSQPPQPQAAPQGYDPFAAQQGLLLDRREALELGSEPSAFEPRIDAGATPGDALEVAFPEQKPSTVPRRPARAVLPRVASPGRGRMALAVGVVALMGGGAAAAWFFLGQTRSTPPAEAVTHAPPPQPVAPAPAQPAPAPPPAAGPPPAAAAPPTTASPARPHPAAARPTTATAATPTAAAPTAAPPARPAPAAPPARRELTSAEVSAAIRGSAKAFSACVAEAADKEPALMGRRVGFLITVNPSGAVTEPRLDDPETDASALGACLKDTARRMVFPAYGGEPFQVRIPMTLGARR